MAVRTAKLLARTAELEAHTAAQADLLAEIKQQRTTIRDLSMPIIPVSATTLVMPLIGVLDGQRLQQMQERSLHTLERTSAHTLVLDITGVALVDSQVAQGLLKTVRAARLLGAQVVLVGIRPEVAQSMVRLGCELQENQHLQRSTIGIGSGERTGVAQQLTFYYSVPPDRQPTRTTQPVLLTPNAPSRRSAHADRRPTT